RGRRRGDTGRTAGSAAATGSSTAETAEPVEAEAGSARGLHQRHEGLDRTDNAVQCLPPLQPPVHFNNVAAGENRGVAAAAAAAAAAALLPVGLFGVAAATTFSLLGVVFYKLYGNTFLHEAFLHHLTRKDPRHNFSPYYYPVYLSYGQANTTTYATSSSGCVDSSPLCLMLASWHAVRRVVHVEEPWRVAMVPQAAALLALAVRFHEDLPSAWLLQ
ncbi:hypothetical protein VOLCADRAFT_101510, partial [Volvox carteri f. nagariensis]